MAVARKMLQGAGATRLAAMTAAQEEREKNMSYNLNDAASAATNGMAKMEERATYELGRAKHGIDAAKDATTSTAREASSTLSTLMKGIATTVSVVSLLRQVDRGLGRLGLSRRKSPFTSLALFGAGAAVGASVGVLFAPASGADTRRAIADRFRGLVSHEPVSSEKGEKGEKNEKNEKNEKGEMKADAAASTASAPAARPATVAPPVPATVAHTPAGGAANRSPLNTPT